MLFEAKYLIKEYGRYKIIRNANTDEPLTSMCVQLKRKVSKCPLKVVVVKQFGTLHSVQV